MYKYFWLILRIKLLCFKKIGDSFIDHFQNGIAQRTCLNTSKKQN